MNTVRTSKSYFRSASWLIAFPLSALAFFSPLPAKAFHSVQTAGRAYLFSDTSGDLVAVGTNRALLVAGQGEVGMPPLVGFSFPEGHVLKDAFDRLSYRLEKEEETGTAYTVVFSSMPLPSGLSFRKVFKIVRNTPFVDISLTVDGSDESALSETAHLRLTLNTDGAGGPFSESETREKRPVFVVKNDSLTMEEFKEASPAVLGRDCWAGFRDRFYSVLIKPAATLVPVDDAEPSGPGRPNVLTFKGALPRAAFSVRLYAGPVDWFSFGEERATLSFLLYDALWFWIRWISFGLFFVLHGMIRVTGSPGLSIVLLSVAVKLAMMPLVRMSDAWQADVNRKNALLEPHLKKIRSQYRGREQHERILALHKELNVHPMYALRTFLGCLIQIPIFFAAYHALSENVDLKGVPFLWIRDLVCPDRLFALPIVLPYFGGYLNVLPLLMTAITIFTASIVRDPVLTRDQLRKQKMNLYVMAAAFLILFYPFPAGMVLYWTTNNLWSLIKELVRKSVDSPVPA